MLGIGDAVPDPPHLDGPGVLEDGVDGDVSPRDADVTLVIDKVAQPQALDALVDTVDVHGPGDRGGGSSTGVGTGHASQPSGVGGLLPTAFGPLHRQRKTDRTPSGHPGLVLAIRPARDPLNGSHRLNQLKKYC